MDNTSYKLSEILQLKQLTIHLKSELKKYKSIVDKMKENDYYALVLRVERENVQLKSEKKDLLEALYYTQKELKQAQEQANQTMQHQEIQRQKKILSIERLLADKNFLEKKNKRLVEAVHKMQDELSIYRQVQGKPNEEDYQQFTKKIEQLLALYMQETMQQVSHVVNHSQYIIEGINQSYSERDSLLREIEEKNSEIEKLREEMIYLQEKSNRLSGSSSYPMKGSFIKNDKILDYLDTQVEKIIEQSLIFEEQYEEKLRILEDLEQQLQHLSNKMEGY